MPATAVSNRRVLAGQVTPPHGCDRARTLSGFLHWSPSADLKQAPSEVNSALLHVSAKPVDLEYEPDYDVIPWVPRSCRRSPLEGVRLAVYGGISLPWTRSTRMSRNRELERSTTPLRNRHHASNWVDECAFSACAQPAARRRAAETAQSVLNNGNRSRASCNARRARARGWSRRRNHPGGLPPAAPSAWSWTTRKRLAHGRHAAPSSWRRSVAG